MTKYFAYGSNMSIARLRARVPGAERTGVFTLHEHALRFHKLSRNDGSGKCDAFYTGNASDRVVGALVELEPVGSDLIEGPVARPVGAPDNSMGAVLEGYIDIPFSGKWILFLTSEDGSKLYLGDELFHPEVA